jgi:hypothetical protein
MDFAGIGAHRNESRTKTATNRDSAKILSFPAKRQALQMAA